jgi:hypothetical protein
MDPPNNPNATIGSPISPGVGYAPSVPLISSFKENKNSISDLILK